MGYEDRRLCAIYLQIGSGSRSGLFQVYAIHGISQSNIKLSSSGFDFPRVEFSWKSRTIIFYTTDIILSKGNHSN